MLHQAVCIISKPSVIYVKIGGFLSRVTLKLEGWPWKTKGYIFYVISSYVHHFKTIGESKLELWSGKAQIGAKFALTFVTLPFGLWPWLFEWTSLVLMVITPEHFTMIQWQKHNETGVMDRKTEGSVLRAAWSQLIMVRFRFLKSYNCLI